MTDDLSTRLLAAIEDFGQHEPDADLVLRLCQAHREIVEHWQATKVALDAAEGTILAGACRVRLGAYGNVLKALARAYDLDSEE